MDVANSEELDLMKLLSIKVYIFHLQCIGYIYRKDLDAEKADALENALDDKGNIVLKVYDKNGKKEIGTFVLTDGDKTQ